MESGDSRLELAPFLNHDDTPKESIDEESISSGSGLLNPFPTGPSVGTAFKNDSLEAFYEPVKSYEGWHRYDPHFKWLEYEEKVVVRRVCSIHNELRCRANTVIDRLAYLHVGVLDVFCTPAG